MEINEIKASEILDMLVTEKAVEILTDNLTSPLEDIMGDYDEESLNKCLDIIQNSSPHLDGDKLYYFIAYLFWGIVLTKRIDFNLEYYDSKKDDYLEVKMQANLDATHGDNITINLSSYGENIEVPSFRFKLER